VPRDSYTSQRSLSRKGGVHAPVESLGRGSDRAGVAAPEYPGRLYHPARAVALTQRQG
jgi:hypothetical protein